MRTNNTSYLHTASGAICILACSIAYCIAANTKALFIDETIMLITANRPILDSLLQTQDYSAPLYQIVLRLITGTTQPSDLAIRLQSIIAGTLSLFIAWKLIRHKVSPFISCCFIIALGLNPFYIEMASMARPYTFYNLFFILSLYYSYKTINSYSKTNVALFSLTNLLLIYTIYLGIPIYIFNTIITYFAISDDRNKKHFRGAFYITSLCIAPAIFLVSRYIHEGLPALYGGWIRKPNILDFIIARRFKDFFGNSYVSLLFFATFLLTLASHISTYFTKTATDKYPHPTNYSKITTVIKQESLQYLVLANIILIYFGFNLISLAFPVYVDRYGFPVVTLLYMCTILCRNIIPGTTHTLIALAIATLSITSLPNIISDDNKGIIPVGKRIEELQSDSNQAYLINWEHGTKWISPELFELRHYGFNTEKYKFIKLEYGKSRCFISDNNFLSNNKHAMIISFVTMENYVKTFLEDNHIQYTKEKYKDYSLFIF